MYKNWYGNKLHRAFKYCMDPTLWPKMKINHSNSEPRKIEH